MLKNRLMKRLFLLSCGLLAGLLFLGAIAPEPRLRPREPNTIQPWSELVHDASRSIDIEQHAKIDAVNLSIASQADWRAICRRLSLALVGNTLSIEEIRAIEQIAPEQRVEWWTEYLLADTRWSHYFSQRFSRAFVGTNNGPFLLFRRRKFELWLASEFHRGAPYDEIVRSMLAAEGLWTDKPEVNFLTSAISNGDNGRVDPIVLAGRTSRAFLGMRIDCVQCHDDLLGNVSLGSDDVAAPEHSLTFNSWLPISVAHVWLEGMRLPA